MTSAIASQRHRRQINDAFASIEATLRQHAYALHALADSQWKLINEAILALLHTTNVTKADQRLHLFISPRSSAT